MMEWYYTKNGIENIIFDVSEDCEVFVPYPMYNRETKPQFWGNPFEHLHTYLFKITCSGKQTKAFVVRKPDMPMDGQKIILFVDSFVRHIEITIENCVVDNFQNPKNLTFFFDEKDYCIAEFIVFSDKIFYQTHKGFLNYSFLDDKKAYWGWK